MIVLIHPNGSGRQFLPDGEHGRVPGLLAQGYTLWPPEQATISTQSEVPLTVQGQIVVPVDFSMLDGVGEDLAAELYGRGWRTLDDLRTATDEELLAVDGIGPAKLRKLRAQL